MKKKKLKKQLQLRKDTVRTLDTDAMAGVRGGTVAVTHTHRLCGPTLDTDCTLLCPGPTADACITVAECATMGGGCG